MKNTLRAAAAAAALAAALAAPASARAQQQRQPRLGLGVSVNANAAVGIRTFDSMVFSPPTSLYLPFYVAPNVRIEPQVGWLSELDDAADVTDSAFALGVGVLVLKPVVATTNLYGGVRVVSTWLRDETREPDADLNRRTQRNTTLAAVFGGEYLPAPWFSVGVEGQLEYHAVGTITTRINGVQVARDSGGSARSTQGLVFLRVYFL